MIRVPHLNESRSQRILWLLEELELPYEIVRYQRNEKTRLAPPELTGADIQMSFACEVARAFGKLAAYPNLSAYLDRLHGREAWKRALEKGGTYDLGV